MKTAMRRSPDLKSESNQVVPLVSIGLPVFNGEDYIDGAIDSILRQTIENFELVISDNASTDSTWDICQSFAARDPRIHLMRNETNLGAAENFNRVFRASTGKYFKWAAADDLCAPRFLDQCIAVLESDESVVLCYPGSEFIDAMGEPTDDFAIDPYLSASEPHNRLHAWLFERTTSCCNLIFGVIRTSDLSRTPLIGKYNSSDVVLLAELALRGKIVQVPEVLFARRNHAGRSVRSHADNEARAVWFDPANSGKVHMPAWRWLREYINAVRRVPIGATEKIRCYGSLARWLVRYRKQLRRELRACQTGWARDSRARRDERFVKRNNDRG